MVQRSVKRSAVRVRWELEEYTLDTPAQEQTVSDSTQIPNPWEATTRQTPLQTPPVLL